MKPRTVRKTAPDRRHALVFTEGIEYSMMRYAHDFRLEARRGRVVEAFRELSSPSLEAFWSPDSLIVAVPLNWLDCLLLFDVAARRYALVGYNPYSHRARLTRDAVRVSVDMEQFRLVFGRQFSPPRPTVFGLASLRWRAAPKRWNLKAAARTAPAPRWLPPPSKAMRAYARKHRITIYA